MDSGVIAGESFEWIFEKNNLSISLKECLNKYKLVHGGIPEGIIGENLSIGIFN